MAMEATNNGYKYSEVCTTYGISKSSLIPKVLFIPLSAFVILGRYLRLQLFLETFETFYECVISLELFGKLIFIKRRLMV